MNALNIINWIWLIPFWIVYDILWLIFLPYILTFRWSKVLILPESSEQFLWALLKFTIFGNFLWIAFSGYTVFLAILYTDSDSRIIEDINWAIPALGNFFN